ncbi:uncharacterized protein LOC122061374 [Macadamia integrifolia]|uniref:uncharacterized protein LOC122061374 n=1 Tax=Macadamia integrifolia TaxID=60698 RepID=UPI001C52F128|nr:uncharacterized protein LOC122061374 [Macadamia integrifolia]
MRNRSSKQGMKGGSEMEMDEKKEGPHLSGAYIRSLVKQLSSSRTKDPSNHKPTTTVAGDCDDGFHLSEVLGETQQPNQNQQQPQPQQPKKQVRRRLHTSRPYQERLLNMAEARREIVTALKFHRASMKQANEQHPLQTLEPPPPQIQPPQPSLQHAEKMKSRRNPRVLHQLDNTTTNYSNYVAYSPPLAFPPQTHFSWPSSSSSSSSPIENYNFSLPNQTLGLNLNLHDFTYNNNPSIYSSSSSSSSSSSYSPPTAMEEAPPSSSTISAEEPPMMDDGSDCGVRKESLLHPAMDDEEMAEIRSIGEKHQMEWNDTLNLMTSAWWFKFLKTMEISPDQESKQEDGFYNPFDEIMEFPSWLNANADENCFLQQNLEYSQDPALPCMDIGEIDGMDAEWLH